MNLRLILNWALICLLLTPLISTCGGSSGKSSRRDTQSSTQDSSGCTPTQRLVAGFNGSVCANPCNEDDECPEGTICHAIAPNDSLALSGGNFCIEPHPTLCQPCRSDDECNPDTPETRNICLARDNDGSFCGGSCGIDGLTCPDGYLCTNITNSGSRIPISQCIPEDDVCDCSPLAVSNNATTSCPIQLATGSCVGERSCTAEGLSSCVENPEATEICNLLDDDCDGLVDEGVNSPCGDCNSECSFDINPQEQSTGTSGAPSRVNITTEQFVDGNPHIWIANSAENTLSRLNTETGCEEARYAVCADPSRTAVDIKGNGVVGCRGDGYVYKIAVSLETCIDKNENGTIETSSDLNGDCVIQPDEMIADDECIVWKAQPVTSGSPCARAAGIDAEGHVWVGMWNAQQLFQLSGETGEILRNHTIGMRPYGLAIDREGTIWVASREPNGVLLKVHPETGIVNSWTNPAGENYGLAVDPFNGVWVATGWATSGLARFDTVEETWQTYTNGGEATRGVAVRLNSDEDGLVTGATVYAAQYAGSCGTNQYVTAIDAETGALLPTIDVGSGMGPVGVAIDSQGHLWTVNQCDNSASKIDTASGEIMGSFPVGNGPYTYSDMTGYALKTITTVSSDYIKRLRGWESGETYWESLTLDAEFPSELTSITVAFRCGNSLEELNASEWFGPFGPYPADGPTPLPIEQTGYYLEVRVTLASKSTSSFPVLNGLSVKASQK